MTTSVKPGACGACRPVCWGGRRPRASRGHFRARRRPRDHPHSNPLECIAMLTQFDPFRESDRLAEQLAAGARTPRPFPMDAYRRGDEFVVSISVQSSGPWARVPYYRSTRRTTGRARQRAAQATLATSCRNEVARARDHDPTRAPWPTSHHGRFSRLGCGRSQPPVKADVGCGSRSEEIRRNGVLREIAGECLHRCADRGGERVE
jgi:hypothetical protein